MSKKLTILLLTIPAIPWAVQLPPEMEADRFLLQARERHRGAGLRAREDDDGPYPQAPG